jgi:hypothetical protein
VLKLQYPVLDKGEAQILSLGLKGEGRDLT